MVSVIACTKRMAFLDNILLNFLRQNKVDKELILIVNTSKIEIDQVKQRLDPYSISKKVYQFSEDVSLGECLNHGVSVSTYETIAKFDDDDYYSEEYLSEAYRAIHQKGADLVGKCSFYIYFKDEQDLYLYHPNQESKWLTKTNSENQFYKSTYFMSGASLVFRRSLFNTVSFSPVNVEEDSLFQKACFDQSFKLYSLTKANYVYIRYHFLHQHASSAIDRQLKNSSQHIAKLNVNELYQYIDQNH